MSLPLPLLSFFFLFLCSILCSFCNTKYILWLHIPHISVTQESQWLGLVIARTAWNSNNNKSNQYRTAAQNTLWEDTNDFRAKWTILPFSTKILCQDSNHSLYRAQNCTVNNDWPFLFITFTTATTTPKYVKTEVKEQHFLKKKRNGERKCLKVFFL